MQNTVMSGPLGRRHGKQTLHLSCEGRRGGRCDESESRVMNVAMERGERKHTRDVMDVAVM